MSVITATALVPARPEEVFAFLADLENHWLLTDRFVEVVALAGPPGARHQGLVRIRGPLGLRRTAATRVRATQAPVWMAGTAELGRGTRANISWTLAGEQRGTRVRLEARVERAGSSDRLLLALGGRLWLRRRFAATVAALASRFRAGPPEARSRRAAPVPSTGDLL